jgi:hypothetical protein
MDTLFALVRELKRKGVGFSLSLNDVRVVVFGISS